MERGVGAVSNYSLQRHVIRQSRYRDEMRTGTNGAVAKSLANGLVGTGFASRYQLQPSLGF